jgi:hypothetical protein
MHLLQSRLCAASLGTVTPLAAATSGKPISIAIRESKGKEGEKGDGRKASGGRLGAGSATTMATQVELRKPET